MRNLVRVSELDERGIVLSCPRCERRNRMRYEGLGQTFHCAQCKNDLPPLSEPVDVRSDLVFGALVSHSAVPVLVDFWAPWCSPCKMVAPEIRKVAARPCDLQNLRVLVSPAKRKLKLPGRWPNRARFVGASHFKLKYQLQRKETTMINTLTRWEPIREMEDFQNRLSTFFGRPLRRGNGHGKEEITLADWTPLADITEDEKEYLIKAELPEMKKEDVKVTVENGVLTISGERKFEKEEKNRKYHRVERGYGTFVRSFTLPDDADAGKVKAEFNDGLLTVHLPKSEKAKPKQIEVKIA